uniref:Secreted protein n=1 Tax=Dicentrarchus labrax TaxID=13489 RepID=A0A8C4IPY1_DICLA
MSSINGHMLSNVLFLCFPGFLVVQPAQISICGFNVVHVLHCTIQCFQHHLAMSCYFGVTQNSSCREDISKSTKIPLSPGVNDQHSVDFCILINLFLFSKRHSLHFPMYPGHAKLLARGC